MKRVGRSSRRRRRKSQLKSSEKRMSDKKHIYIERERQKNLRITH